MRRAASADPGVYHSRLDFNGCLCLADPTEIQTSFLDELVRFDDGPAITLERVLSDNGTSSSRTVSLRTRKSVCALQRSSETGRGSTFPPAHQAVAAARSVNLA